MHKPCPRGCGPLHQQNDENRSIWGCAVCHGGFLTPPMDHDLLTRFKAIDREAFDPQICCPQDGTDLTLVDVSGVSVDVCSTCNSVWLDDGEIEQLQGMALPGISEQEGAARAKFEGQVVDVAGDALSMAFKVFWRLTRF